MPTARVDDLSVAYDDAGSGEPVLMMNGIGATRGAWFLQVPALAEFFRVITYDNRDAGETGPSAADSHFAIRRFADDAAGLLDSLDIPSAHVVGASMGGCIAQEFAISHPSRTKSVTIVCSWPSVEPWLAELWAQWEAVFAALGPVAWARTTWLWVFTHRWYQDPAHLQDLLDLVERDPHPQSLAMYLRQSHAAKSFDATGRLGQIAVPVHVIAGAEDIFTPPRYSRAIGEAIPGSTLSIIPNAGHGMFWEATEEFNRLVIEFIRANAGHRT